MTLHPQRGDFGYDRCMRLAGFAIVVCLAGGTAALGDDSAGYSNGTEFRMSGSQTVRMVSEKVLIDVDRIGAAVHCRFVFKNEGPGTVVTMGFPNEPYGDASNAKLDGFRSRVDGRSVRARIQKDGSGPDERRVFYVKRVAFKADQTRVVEDSYRTALNGNTFSWSGISYVMETGASWKGNIGNATVLVRFHDRQPSSSLTVAQEDRWLAVKPFRNKIPKNLILWSGFAIPRVHGTTLLFQRSDFKPTTRSNVILTFQG